MIERNHQNTPSAVASKPYIPPREEDVCCVSVNKIFDSAMDKDCIEDLRVQFCTGAQEIIDRATAVRCTDVEVLYTGISVDDVPFNRGYYRVSVRYFFGVTLECCVCSGQCRTVRGLCTFDKKTVLYGSEKNVSVFRSDPENDSFCVDPCKLKCNETSTLPSVVLEVAPPIALDVRLKERVAPCACCCLNSDAIPERVKSRFDGEFADAAGNTDVFLSLGLFSVIRMERNVQLALPSCDFCVPDQSSTPLSDASDPCGMFGNMEFPTEAFYPYLRK